MLNLRYQYTPLFTLKVLHNFYLKQTSDELKLSPTPRTVGLVDKMRFMLKEKDGEFNALFDNSRLEALGYFLNHFDHIKFSFWLYSSNDYFINFTDLPTETTDSILYFNNLEPRPDQNGEFFLHDTDFINEAQFAPLRPSSFGYLPSKEGAQIEIRDSYNQLVQNGVVDPGLKFQVEVGPSGEGLYKILEDGDENSRFVYPGQNLAKNPLALIEIELSDEIKKEIIAKIQAEEVPPVYKYKIRFEARSTYWKYFIASKYLNGLDQVEIQSPDTDISFTGPEEVTLVNGDKAFSFLSEKVLPLQEFPQHVFQLKKGNGPGESGGRMLLDRLPVPSVQSIIPESRSNGSKIFSEIFVYL